MKLIYCYTPNKMYLVLFLCIRKILVYVAQPTNMFSVRGVMRQIFADSGHTNYNVQRKSIEIGGGCRFFKPTWSYLTSIYFTSSLVDKYVLLFGGQL